MVIGPPKKKRRKAWNFLSPVFDDYLMADSHSDRIRRDNPAAPFARPSLPVKVGGNYCGGFSRLAAVIS